MFTGTALGGRGGSGRRAGDAREATAGRCLDRRGRRVGVGREPVEVGLVRRALLDDVDGVGDELVGAGARSAIVHAAGHVPAAAS